MRRRPLGVAIIIRVKVNKPPAYFRVGERTPINVAQFPRQWHFGLHARKFLSHFSYTVFFKVRPTMDFLMIVLSIKESIGRRGSDGL